MALALGRRSGPAALLAALTLAVCLLAGCGSDTGDAAAPGSGETPPPSPLARIALEGPFGSLDPLYVKGRADRVLSRQVYDPPVSRLDAPLGVTGFRRGPLLPIGTDPGSPNWRFEVRPGLQFQDGSPLNVDAVVLNFGRWLASGAASKILPELDAVDIPVPGRIRFQLSAPVPDLPARLSDPRFGLVSPATLKRYRLDEIPRGEGGSGAFVPRSLSPDRALLDASPNWWGTEAGLGPGVERLEFHSASSRIRRLALLHDGAVDVADDLGPRAATLIAEQPLLAMSAEAEDFTGASAAVRGLRPGPLDQPLSELWLTELRP